MACQRRLPPLLDVHELSSQTVARHERITLLGAGFPAGRSGQVTFRGRVHVAGELPRAVEIVARGQAVGEERVEVRFDEALEQRFLGHGAVVRHGTFRGGVEVDFEAPGGAKVYGARDGVELDVLPPGGPSAELREQGLLALRALGGEPADTDGVLLERVAEGSVLAHYGVSAGDRLLSFAGVRVRDLSDLSSVQVPRPLELVVLSGIDQHEHVLAIAEPPFEEPVGLGLLLPLVALVGLSLAAALWTGEWLPSVRRWELALWALWRSPRLRAERWSEAAGGASPSVAPPQAARWTRRALQFAPAAVVWGALAWLPAAARAREFDVPILWVAWATAQLLVLTPQPAQWPWWRRALGFVSASIDALWPLLALTAIAVHHTASLRLLDVSRAQSGGQWTVLSTPWASALSVLWIWQLARRHAAAPAQGGKVVLGWVADALGLAVFVVIGCAGWEPPMGGAVPHAHWVGALAWLSKAGLIAALVSGCTRWRLRANGRDVDGARAPALRTWALAWAAVGLQFTLGVPAVWLANWPALALVCALIAGAVLGVRAFTAGPNPDDELPQLPLSAS